MNRRSFIAGVLAAMVAPAVLIPKSKDHARWRVRRHHGFYIAEFRYAVKPMADEELQNMEVFVREPDHHFEPNPEYISALYEIDLPEIDPARQYAGKWQFIEWHWPPSFVPA